VRRKREKELEEEKKDKGKWNNRDKKSSRRMGNMG